MREEEIRIGEKSLSEDTIQNSMVVSVEELRPWQKNARQHSNKQLKQIAASISEFGFTNPVLIDQDKTILAGHGRVEAAKLLKIDKVPCIQIEHMSSAQKRAYVLADNKIALNATWDEDLLSEELAALSEIDLDFDLSLTGFTIGEIDQIIDIANPEGDLDTGCDFIPDSWPEKVRPGDVWALGPHRLVCGDSLDEAVVSKLMQGDKARLIFTDPPYNVPIAGHVGGNGAIQHREFAMASGEMNRDEFVQFLAKAFSNLADHSKDGSIHFICMDWRHMSDLMVAAEGVYSELKNLIVWSKDRGGMGSFYRSRHELIFVYKRGKAEHFNSFELGQHGRYRTNVWDYRAASLEDLKLHPTVKPVQMIADAIRDVSKRNDLVLDLFGGSGSTLIAAERTGRRARLCELDSLYCDLILARFEAFAKEEPELLFREEPILVHQTNREAKLEIG